MCAFFAPQLLKNLPFICGFKVLEFTANAWTPISQRGATSGKTPVVTASADSRAGFTSEAPPTGDIKSPAGMSTGSRAPETPESMARMERLGIRSLNTNSNINTALYETNSNIM